MMTPLMMIAEWRRGCSCSTPENPELCHDCTRALVDALEAKLKRQQAVEERALNRDPGCLQAVGFIFLILALVAAFEAVLRAWAR